MNLQQYRNIPYTPRTQCQICGTDIYSLLSFPLLPMTEIYVSRKIKEKLAVCDQSFQLCEACGHGQLKNVIDTKLQYNDTYSFRTSKSTTGRECSDFFTDYVKTYIDKPKLLIEIGANDNYLLNNLRHEAKKLIGIDPVLNNETHGNITSIKGFFEDWEFEEKADVVICKDTLEHIECPLDLVDKALEAGHDKTLYFFEFPLLEVLLSGYHFNQVFHQHLNYFSFSSIKKMLEILGCELLGYKVNYVHFGSIIIIFRKGKGKFERHGKVTIGAVTERYRVFNSALEITKEQIEHTKDLVAYGAENMLPVLDYHLENALEKCEFVYDDDENKHGKYYINLPLQIRKTEILKDRAVIVTATATTNNTRRIITKLQQERAKHIIVPFNIL